MSWIFLFSRCLPHQLFKFIAYVEEHNPSIRCLIREPVLLIAYMQIFSILLYPSSGSFSPAVLLAAAAVCWVVGAVAGRGPGCTCPGVSLALGVNLGAPFYSSHLGLFSLKEVPVQSICVHSVHSGIHLAVVISCYF